LRRLDDEPERVLDLPVGELPSPRPRSWFEWAAAWPERTWAIEGASGLGHLLAQQIVAVGERVLDIQARLERFGCCRRDSKNDPNDALSVAVAALR